MKIFLDIVIWDRRTNEKHKDAARQIHPFLHIFISNSPEELNRNWLWCFIIRSYKCTKGVLCRVQSDSKNITFYLMSYLSASRKIKNWKHKWTKIVLSGFSCDQVKESDKRWYDIQFETEFRIQFLVFWVMTICNLVGDCEGFGGTSSHHPQSEMFFQCADDRLKDRAMSNSRTSTLNSTVMQTTNLEINCTRTDVCRTHTKQLKHFLVNP